MGELGYLRGRKEVKCLHLDNDFRQCVVLVESRDDFPELLPVLGLFGSEHVHCGCLLEWKFE